MKKLITLSIVAVLVLSLGAIAFADTVATKEIPEWFTEMMKWKKDQVQQAVENKQITEEQAKLFNDRLDQMQKYHEENGFDFPNGCGMGGKFNQNGKGFGRGFGRGMMGGNCLNAVPQTPIN